MLPLGAVCKAGGARSNKTGSWRDFRPNVTEICNGCGICELFCPDSCISIEENKCVINYDYCKGCGICNKECPRGAIKMQEERK
ncbi:MAG: 4Fe-4S binding protein [Peptococcaceae bacterium]|nr:4Fe-4S binding protein [Peptococcaceae bacterium]MDH7525383.1 4Fe-4S binding protein [Peptococcaceae bacterium]